MAIFRRNFTVRSISHSRTGSSVQFDPARQQVHGSDANGYFYLLSSEKECFSVNLSTEEAAQFTVDGEYHLDFTPVVADNA